MKVFEIFIQIQKIVSPTYLSVEIPGNFTDQLLEEIEELRSSLLQDINKIITPGELCEIEYLKEFHDLYFKIITMGKGNTFVPNGGESIGQSIDIDNYVLEEYSFEIDKPEQVLKRSLRSIFVGGNISEISVNLVKDCYHELKKHNEYIQKIQHLQSGYNGLLITGTNYEAHFEVCIPILDIISMSSDLIEESDLDLKRKSELKQEYYTTFQNTITQGKFSAFFRNNSSPYREDFEELRIDDTFIRRLEIAAGKQKIKDILSGEHKYSRSSEKLIDETRKKLSQLGFTHKDIDKHIKNNSKT